MMVTLKMPELRKVDGKTACIIGTNVSLQSHCMSEIFRKYKVGVASLPGRWRKGERS